MVRRRDLQKKCGETLSCSLYLMDSVDVSASSDDFCLKKKNAIGYNGLVCAWVRLLLLVSWAELARVAQHRTF